MKTSHKMLLGFAGFVVAALIVSLFIWKALAGSRVQTRQAGAVPKEVAEVIGIS